MELNEIIKFLESLAPPMLQEEYDNAGLITGNATWNCTGAVVSLDATEEVINEAIDKKCNLVIAHHPIVFKGLKKITGKNYVERTIIKAIKHDIAVYAIHTNLDNTITGVNGKIAELLGLTTTRILSAKAGLLQKLVVFVPEAQKETVLQAMFAAGAGSIGFYSECSFESRGTGSFKAAPGTNPFVGEPGTLHYEPESRLEVILPAWKQPQVLAAMLRAHPYEEVAYDIYALKNNFRETGAGIIGQLPQPMPAKDVLQKLRDIFGTPVIKHTALPAGPVNTVAICGGAGSFLTKEAIAAGADIYITADVKYHEFFDAEGRLVLADIGHYESEQFTSDLLVDYLQEKFPKFAVLKTGVVTNPVHYF